MEEKELTIKDVVRMLTEQGQATAELIHGLSEHVDERFEQAGQESAEQFRQVHLEIADLREITMPLEEQSELRLRVHRIEDHLGLSHEVKPAM